MPALEDGQRFERYRVVQWLGSGVSGESYEAEDLRKVTLKLIHPQSTLNEPDYVPFLLADVGLANFVRRFGQPQTPFLPITAAPEQLGKRVTPASDQFALAVLLYLWIAGRPPYLGSPQEIENLKLTESITPLTSLNRNASIERKGLEPAAICGVSTTAVRRLRL